MRRSNEGLINKLSIDISMCALDFTYSDVVIYNLDIRKKMLKSLPPTGKDIYK